MKKGKQNTGKLELNFLQITILKAIKQTPCLSFWACEKKKIMEFTDSTHIMYWPVKIALKVANSEQLKIIFLFMSVINTLQKNVYVFQ